MKYRMLEHGLGVTVYNIKTNKIGIVKLIKETYHEYIEPFVDYGDGVLVKEVEDFLEVIDVHKNPKASE